MHAQTKARPEPYVWVSWLTKLLAGESSCLWSAWFRAHYQTAKAPNGFDMTAWQMEHAALLRKTATEYEEEGYKVHTEGQNMFALKGKVGTLSGKPDMVAVEGVEGWVVDTKTGWPKLSDQMQVMLYMWALPKTVPAFAGVRLYGKVVYKVGCCVVRPEEIDTTFITTVSDLMKVVCGEAEPRKAPSYTECQHCSITVEDCADRAGAVRVYEGETDEF
jgi:hypothetical protein